VTTTTDEQPVDQEEFEPGATGGFQVKVQADEQGLVHVKHPARGVLTIDPTQRELTELQKDGFEAMGLDMRGEFPVPVTEALLFLHRVQAARLDPYRKQAYLIPFGSAFNNEKGERVDTRKWAFVIGIDGFRKIGAEAAHGSYTGQTKPLWYSEERGWQDVWLHKKWGFPEAARVGLKHISGDITESTVMWDEIAPLEEEKIPIINEKTGEPVLNRWRKPAMRKTGNMVPNKTWQRMPALMLAKCAEAQAWRRLFPDTFSGIYEPAEVDRMHDQYLAQRAAITREATEQRENRAAVIEEAGRRRGQQQPAGPVEGQVATTGQQRQQAEARATSVSTPRTIPGEATWTDSPVPAAQAAAEAVEDVQRRAERREAVEGMSAEERTAALRAEIEAIARLTGRNVDTLVKRHAAQWRTSFDAWDEDLLQQYLDDPHSGRAGVIRWMRREGIGQPEWYEGVPAGEVLPPSDFGKAGLA
jgi:hypothetical protein